MPTVRLALAALALGAVLGGLGAGAAHAQAPLYLVNDSTTVRSLRFRYVDSKTLQPAQLKQQIATKAPGFFESGWRRSLYRLLPLIGEPGVYPFDPITLQKDVVRLERYYRRNGFPRPAVDYLVRLDTTDNDVAVLFVVAEGPPLLIDSLTFAGPGGTPAFEQLDPALQAEWRAFRDRIALQQGERLTDFRLVQLQDQALGWLLEHGYAFADVSAEARVDSVAFQADVRIKMTAGPRARYGQIVVEGVESVSERVVLRELPFAPGEPFRQSELTEGQRQVFSLNLFQLAAVDVADSLSSRDAGLVGVRALVRETDPRVITGFAGYSSAGGLTATAQWTHRNFFGDARSFTASLVGQSGLGAVEQDPEIAYEARLSLRQPYLFNRDLSAAVEPFARYQDDVVERSTQYGVSANLLYSRGALQTLTLSPAFSTRTVGSDSVSLVDPSTLLPGSAFSITRTQLRLTGALGRVDDALNPRRGFILRPAATVTSPLLSDVEYGALSLTATGFLPFGRRAGLIGRVTGGYLLPLGSTDAAAPFDYLALRDALYFAGGTSDVRGWPSNLLGPKFIDFVAVDTTVTFEEFASDPGVDDPVTEYYRRRYSVRYRPVGGEAKVSASVQVNVPLPLGPQWGASAFVDAGRVFDPAGGLYALFEQNAPAQFPDLPFLVDWLRSDDPAFRVGAGAGVQYLTTVGYVTLALGYKLNPSAFDLRDPVEVFRAADIEDLDPGPPDLARAPAHWTKRLQVHLSIGQRF
ncbi:MAG TPA: BamA/TamA family outer membrane protein [Rubricoccaceae bacterium]|nr:BamA/TamA family outer membrane protein [Rubricoccaceae bacterium]